MNGSKVPNLWCGFLWFDGYYQPIFSLYHSLITYSGLYKFLFCLSYLLACCCQHQSFFISFNLFRIGSLNWQTKNREFSICIPNLIRYSMSIRLFWFLWVIEICSIAWNIIINEIKEEYLTERIQFLLIVSCYHVRRHTIFLNAKITFNIL